MKAVLVFCEGYHDVVFAQRSLGAHGGCEWVGRPIRELPTPFGSDKVARKAFIAKRVARGYQDSRRLFRLPQRDARPDRHDRGSSGTDGGTRLARSVRRGWG